MRILISRDEFEEKVDAFLKKASVRSPTAHSSEFIQCINELVPYLDLQRISENDALILISHVTGVKLYLSKDGKNLSEAEVTSLPESRRYSLSGESLFNLHGWEQRQFLPLFSCFLLGELSALVFSGTENNLTQVLREELWICVNASRLVLSHWRFFGNNVDKEAQAQMLDDLMADLMELAVARAPLQLLLPVGLTKNHAVYFSLFLQQNSCEVRVFNAGWGSGTHSKDGPEHNEHICPYYLGEVSFEERAGVEAFKQYLGVLFEGSYIDLSKETKVKKGNFLKKVYEEKIAFDVDAKKREVKRYAYPKQKKPTCVTHNFFAWMYYCNHRIRGQGGSKTLYEILIERVIHFAADTLAENHVGSSGFERYLESRSSSASEKTSPETNFIEDIFNSWNDNLCNDEQFTETIVGRFSPLKLEPHQITPLLMEEDALIHQERQWDAYNLLVTEKASSDRHQQMEKNIQLSQSVQNELSLETLFLNHTQTGMYDAPQKTRKVLVLGPPGVGKTTFSRMYAYKLAKKQIPPFCEKELIVLPIFLIRFKAWIERTGISHPLGKNFLLASYLLDTFISGKKYRDIVKQKIDANTLIQEMAYYLDANKNKLFFVIDGYDEISLSNSPAERTILKWLETEVLHCKKSYCLLTTRPPHLLIENRRTDVFQKKVTLIGFGFKQIVYYIEQFFETRGTKKLEQGDISEITSVVRENERLSRLIQVPLTCEAFCEYLYQKLQKIRQVHEKRGFIKKTIPALTLSDLYGFFVEKKKNEPGYQTVCQKAYESLSKGTNVISFDEISPTDRAGLGALFLTCIDNEDNKEYAFIHASIHDYMASRAILAELEKIGNSFVQSPFWVKVCEQPNLARALSFVFSTWGKPENVLRGYLKPVLESLQQKVQSTRGKKIYLNELKVYFLALSELYQKNDANEQLSNIISPHIAFWAELLFKLLSLKKGVEVSEAWINLLREKPNLLYAAPIKKYIDGKISPENLILIETLGRVVYRSDVFVSCLNDLIVNKNIERNVTGLNLLVSNAYLTISLRPDAIEFLDQTLSFRMGPTDPRGYYFFIERIMKTFRLVISREQYSWDTIIEKIFFLAQSHSCLWQLLQQIKLDCKETIESFLNVVSVENFAHIPSICFEVYHLDDETKSYLSEQLAARLCPFSEDYVSGKMESARNKASAISLIFKLLKKNPGFAAQIQYAILEDFTFNTLLQNGMLSLSMCAVAVFFQDKKHALQRIREFISAGSSDDRGQYVYNLTTLSQTMALFDSEKAYSNYTECLLELIRQESITQERLCDLAEGLINLNLFSLSDANVQETFSLLRDKLGETHEKVVRFKLYLSGKMSIKLSESQIRILVADNSWIRFPYFLRSMKDKETIGLATKVIIEQQKTELVTSLCEITDPFVKEILAEGLWQRLSSLISTDKPKLCFPEIDLMVRVFSAWECLTDKLNPTRFYSVINALYMLLKEGKTPISLDNPALYGLIDRFFETLKIIYGRTTAFFSDPMFQKIVDDLSDPNIDKGVFSMMVTRLLSNIPVKIVWLEQMAANLVRADELLLPHPIYLADNLEDELDKERFILLCIDLLQKGNFQLKLICSKHLSKLSLEKEVYVSKLINDIIFSNMDRGLFVGAFERTPVYKMIRAFKEAKDPYIYLYAIFFFLEKRGIRLTFEGEYVKFYEGGAQKPFSEELNSEQQRLLKLYQSKEPKKIREKAKEYGLVEFLLAEDCLIHYLCCNDLLPNEERELEACFFAYRRLKTLWKDDSVLMVNFSFLGLSRVFQRISEDEPDMLNNIVRVVALVSKLTQGRQEYAFDIFACHLLLYLSQKTSVDFKQEQAVFLLRIIKSSLDKLVRSFEMMRHFLASLSVSLLGTGKQMLTQKENICLCIKNLWSLYLEDHNFDKVIYLCETFEAFSKSFEAAQNKAIIGYAYQRRGDFDKAMVCYQSSLEYDTTNEDILVLYAIVLCQARQYPQAITTIRRLEEGKIDSIDANDINDFLSDEIPNGLQKYEGLIPLAIPAFCLFLRAKIYAKWSWPPNDNGILDNLFEPLLEGAGSLSLDEKSRIRYMNTRKLKQAFDEIAAKKKSDTTPLEQAHVLTDVFWCQHRLNQSDFPLSIQQRASVLRTLAHHTAYKSNQFEQSVCYFNELIAIDEANAILYYLERVTLHRNLKQRNDALECLEYVLSKDNAEMALEGWCRIAPLFQSLDNAAQEALKNRYREWRLHASIRIETPRSQFQLSVIDVFFRADENPLVLDYWKFFIHYESIQDASPIDRISLMNAMAFLHGMNLMPVEIKKEKIQHQTGVCIEKMPTNLLVNRHAFIVSLRQKDFAKSFGVMKGLLRLTHSLEEKRQFLGAFNCAFIVQCQFCFVNFLKYEFFKSPESDERTLLDWGTAESGDERIRKISIFLLKFVLDGDKHGEDALRDLTSNESFLAYQELLCMTVEILLRQVENYEEDPNGFLQLKEHILSLMDIVMNSSFDEFRKFSIIYEFNRVFQEEKFRLQFGSVLEDLYKLSCRLRSEFASEFSWTEQDKTMTGMEFVDFIKGKLGLEKGSPTQDNQATEQSQVAFFSNGAAPISSQGIDNRVLPAKPPSFSTERIRKSGCKKESMELSFSKTAIIPKKPHKKRKASSVVQSSSSTVIKQDAVVKPDQDLAVAAAPLVQHHTTQYITNILHPHIEQFASVALRQAENVSIPISPSTYTLSTRGVPTMSQYTRADLITHLKQAPFASYGLMIQHYQQLNSVLESASISAASSQTEPENGAKRTQLKACLMDLPQAITQGHIASQINSLAALIYCEDTDITRAVLNRLDSALKEELDGSLVYSCLTQVAHQLQVSKQACDEGSIVALLKTLLSKLDEELQNLGELNSDKAFKALQASVSLVDCLLLRGILLGNTRLEEFRHSSQLFSDTLSYNCTHYPLHDFWGGYLKAGLSALTSQLTPLEMKTFRQKLFIELAKGVGAGSKGALHAGLGTASLAVGVAAAATGFGFHALPDAVLAFVLGLYELGKSAYEVRKHVRKAKKVYDTLHQTRGEGPHSPSYDALQATCAQAIEAFWTMLHEKVIKSLDELKKMPGPFEREMLAYSLTDLLCQVPAPTSKMPVAQACVQAIQALFKETYFQSSKAEALQRFILLQGYQLQQQGYDFPAWENKPACARFYLANVPNETEVESYTQLKKYETLSNSDKKANYSKGKRVAIRKFREGLDKPKEAQIECFIKLIQQLREIVPQQLGLQYGLGSLNKLDAKGLEEAWFKRFEGDHQLYIQAEAELEDTTGTSLTRTIRRESVVRIESSKSQATCSSWGEACLAILKELLPEDTMKKGSERTKVKVTKTDHLAIGPRFDHSSRLDTTVENAPSLADTLQKLERGKKRTTLAEMQRLTEETSSVPTDVEVDHADNTRIGLELDESVRVREIPSASSSSHSEAQVMAKRKDSPIHSPKLKTIGMASFKPERDEEGEFYRVTLNYETMSEAQIEGLQSKIKDYIANKRVVKFINSKSDRRGDFLTLDFDNESAAKAFALYLGNAVQELSQSVSLPQEEVSVGKQMDPA